MDTRIYSSASLFLQVVLTLHLIVSSASAVQCHFCFDTNVREDCYITKKSCHSDFVCFVETSHVSRSGVQGEPDEETLVMYKMGCEHYSLCRDKTIQGQSHYGYAVTSHECCCDPLCEKADGVGKGRLDGCPRLWSNNTKQEVVSGQAPVVLAGSGNCYVWLTSINIAFSILMNKS